MTCLSAWFYISFFIALITVAGGMFLVYKNKVKMVVLCIFLPMIIFLFFRISSSEEDASKFKCQIAQSIGSIFGLKIKPDQEFTDVKYQVLDVKYISNSYKMCYYKDANNVACDQIYKNAVKIKESTSGEKYFLGKCDVMRSSIFLDCKGALIYLPKQDIKELLILK